MLIDAPPVIFPRPRLLPDPWHGPPVRLPPPRDPRPPVWHAIVITILAIPATLLLGCGLGVVLVIILISQGTFGSAPPDPSEITDLLFTPEGLLAVIIPSQGIFAAAALLGAKLTRRPWRETLGFGAPRPGIWLTPLLAISSFPMVFACAWIVNAVTSDSMKDQDLFSRALDRSEGAMTIVLMLAMSVLPGIVEEMLFRGYLQRRLLMQWPPLAAIVVSTAIFAVAHMSLQIPFVIPIGLWLGFIAWRTGSIWHTMFCHAAYNVMMLGPHLLERAGVELEDQMPWRVCGSLIAFVASVIILVRWGGRSASAIGKSNAAVTSNSYTSISDK